jgi:hypothetical protein
MKKLGKRSAVSYQLSAFYEAILDFDHYHQSELRGIISPLVFG